MKKNILILNGNPKNDSLCGELSDTYRRFAEPHNSVRSLELSDMQFDPDLSFGYRENQELEPDLAYFQKSIQWLDHLVVVTPIWWGSLPAKTKGLFDRTFLPGFAFQYQKGKVIPEKLLKGKSCRLIFTMDTPPWYYRLAQGAPGIKTLDTCTLRFSGFKKAGVNLFGPVLHAKEKKRQQWIQVVGELGKKAA